MKTADDLLARWAARDRARALVPADRAAVDATEAPRALVVEGLLGDVQEKDLLHASGVLGRLLAGAGATPTLAGGTIDALEAEAPADRVRDGASWASVRAAVAEGYAAARDEAALAASCAAWEYPRAVVRIDAYTVAVAAGYPADDGEMAAAWAARVAGALHKAGVRRAFVEGRDPAKAELAAALELAGVELLANGALGAPPPPPRFDDDEDDTDDASRREVTARRRAPGQEGAAPRERFSLASWLKKRLV